MAHESDSRLTVVKPTKFQNLKGHLKELYTELEEEGRAGPTDFCVLVRRSQDGYVSYGISADLVDYTQILGAIEVAKACIIRGMFRDDDS